MIARIALYIVLGIIGLALACFAGAIVYVLAVPLPL